MIGNQKKFILNEEKINIKKNSEINNKYIEELKLELNLAKSQAQNLNNILNGYKSQNNQLIIEFNQRKKEQTNEIDSLKFSVELQKKQIIEISANLHMKEKKLIEIQSELDVVSNTYKNLEKANQILIKEKNEATKDFQEIQNELNLLRTYLNEKEKDNLNVNDSIKIGGGSLEFDNSKLNEELEQLRKYVNIRNKECDEINKNLNSAKDEKNILINNLNDMKLELEKYKILAATNNKDTLYKKYQKIKKENEINLNKKKYYKEQCRLCNQIIDLIKTKLTKQQNTEIENDKTFQKLIDIKCGNKFDNYSFNNNTNSKIQINKNSYNEIKISNNLENSYKKNFDKENSNINNNNNFNNYENENNNKIILNDKFNSNIINDIDIDNKNDKEKNNNNDDDISEHISYYESINK
jgi:hypothetical protein